MFARFRQFALVHPLLASFAVLAAFAVVAGAVAVGRANRVPATPAAASSSPSPVQTPDVSQQVAAAERRAERQARRLVAENAPRKVYYLLKGSTSSATITYTTTGGGTGQRTVHIESVWQHEGPFRLSAGDVAYVSAQNSYGYGSVACKIVETGPFGDRVVAPVTWSSGAYAITTCNGSVS